MKYYLGIDIGTFETKGVLVDGAGEIVARAARAHKMLANSDLGRCQRLRGVRDGEFSENFNFFCTSRWSM